MYDKQLAKFRAAAEAAGLQVKGKTMPYTSVNGHMHSLLQKEGHIGIRLGKDDYQQFHETYGDSPFMSHGAVMREYVPIPQKVVDDHEALTAYFKKSFEYTSSLKPKATTKKKK